MKLNWSIVIAFALYLCSCTPDKEKVDAIYYNATVYTVDKDFKVGSEFGIAIKDGKYVDVDSAHLVLRKYDAPIKEDLNGAPLYPGFYDAHCHFLGYAKSLQQVNVVGTSSWDGVLEITKKFVNENQELSWVVGRGWDQNDWEIKEFPTNDKLNELFPNLPVILRRVDGHAAIVNDKVLELAGIDTETKVDGGLIEVKEGKLTGILIDNAVDLVLDNIPELSKEAKIVALKKAEQDCFEVGLTTVDDAGLDLKEIMLYDSLQKSGVLNMHIYAMLNPGSKEFDFAKKNGYYQTEKLNVRSFKVYADGALGSRGACLKADYTDRHGHRGFLLSEKDSLQIIAGKIASLNFQMNTHCIGDSANKLLLDIYGKHLKGEKGKRWRIEHAQVVDLPDMVKFKSFDIIPSVQPTHCTSDMYWAEERLGPERIKGAYAYNTLLKQHGLIAGGSDFPIESINPLYGFYAGVARKDQNNYPEGGFYKDEAITREEALKAMTIWAAYSNFEENEKGSIEVGKRAAFVVLEDDIMTMPEEDLYKAKVIRTVIDGEEVFNRK